MCTSYANISDVKFNGMMISIKLNVVGEQNPIYCNFNLTSGQDYFLLKFIRKITKAEFIEDIKGRSLRVIYLDNNSKDIIAFGYPMDDKFLDIKLGRAKPISEKRIYRRYKSIV